MREIRNLGDACSEIVDCAHKTAPIDEEGQFFAVGTPAMRDGDIDYAEARRISYETFRDWTSRLRPRFGDLLLAREAPVGPVARIPEAENVAPGQRTVLLRPREMVVESRFLYYYMISPTMQSELQVRASGSTVAHLNVADVRLLATPGIPTYPTQKAISEVLGAFDNKITANTQIRILVDDLLQTRFRHLTRGSGTAELRDIADVNVRKTNPQPGSSLRYLDISSVGQGGYANPEKTPWEAAPGRARRGLTSGDTVWSTVRPNRRSHALVLDSDPLLVASTGLAVLSPKLGRTAGTYEATRREEFVAYLESVAEGSAYPAVRGDRFETAPIPDLDATEWETFEQIALPLRMRVHAANVETRALKGMRDELLPLLMSGKLRIRDAEQHIAEVI